MMTVLRISARVYGALPSFYARIIVFNNDYVFRSLYIHLLLLKIVLNISLDSQDADFKDIIKLHFLFSQYVLSKQL